MHSKLKSVVYWRQQVKHFMWSRGWDLRRFTRMNGIDALLWKLLAELQVNCIIDVGAHTGEFGMQMRGLGYTGRIASFEPTHSVVGELRRRTDEDPDWHVYEVALGSSSGTADFNVTCSTDFSSFRKSSELGGSIFAQQLETAAVERVQIRRLDELFSDVVRGINDPRIYLKLDTQGWDLEVLAGATGCLDRIVAAQSEMSIRPIYDGMPSHTDAIAAFHAVGFDVVGLFMLLPSQVDGLLNEFDCVMICRSAADQLTGRGGAPATFGSLAPQPNRV